MTTEKIPRMEPSTPAIADVLDEVVTALVLVLKLDEADPFAQARRPRTGTRTPTYRDLAQAQYAAARALAAKDGFYSVDLDPQAHAQVAGAILSGLATLDDLRGDNGEPARGTGAERLEDFDRGDDPIEFGETPAGYCARERWARSYDERNGAPEGDSDR